jgi:hypothetical protein
MSHVIKKFNEALSSLESRTYESKANLAGIERMYGVLLGLTMSIQDTNSNEYEHMRFICNKLMQDMYKKRTLKTWKAFDWIEFKKGIVQWFWPS